MTTTTEVEVSQLVIDATKASKLLVGILGAAISFVGFAAGGAWTVATWKLGVENHLQRTDDRMEQINRKLDWLIAESGRQSP